MTKNDHAREAGIPKAFRQYAARYGVSVEAVIQTHRKFPALVLDHWRDKGNVARRMFGLPETERSLWHL